jgi:hypothetical protein
MKMYATYINNYPTAYAIIERHQRESKDFAQFLDTATQNPRNKRQTLQSWLITPIQRVPRYVLLLNDLLKHTPDDHPDRPELSTAARKMRVLADELNECKRLAENSKELLIVAGVLSPPIDVCSSDRSP